jgi:hypothetical protein
MTIRTQRSSQAGALCTQTNFGGNQTWRARCYQPGSEHEVLEILQRHRHGHVRPVGAKHSWSDVAACGDVALDMARFNHRHVYETHGEQVVRVGAGCRVQDLLAWLHATSDRTLPTLGAVTRQTIAGAIATGTHGSGRPSLSHFVVGVRLAAYDPSTGQPKVFEYRDGDALKAARCGLGCLGVVLAVDLRTVPQYTVEETVVRHTSLEHVLRRYHDCPLTQFLLLPYTWDYVAFERKPLEGRSLSRRERLTARLFRLYHTVWVDVLFHLSLKGSLMAGRWAVKSFLKVSPHGLIKGVPRVDDAEQVLTMGHHYFRHEEMEVFVAESRLREAVEVLRCATEVFAHPDRLVPAAMATQLRALDLYGELLRHRGTYTQHYPFFFRRVLPEDTLLSMASAAEEPFYSLSVFTYNQPGQRQAYYTFCSWLARCLTSLVGGRLHWGKHFPLGVTEIARVYPQLETFQHVCRHTDPDGVFRNGYTERVLGLPAVRRDGRRG